MKYKHLMETDSEVMPFVMEATGGLCKLADVLLRRLGTLYRTSKAELGDRRLASQKVLQHADIMSHKCYRKLA